MKQCCKDSAQKTAQAYEDKMKELFAELDRHFVSGHSAYYEMKKYEYLGIKAKYLGNNKKENGKVEG